MKMKIKSLLLVSVALCGLTLSACNKNADKAPDGSYYANVDVLLDNGLRATFIGGANDNDPTKISWGTVGTKLPMLVYKGAASTAAQSATFELFDDYAGDLKFTYTDVDLNGGNKFNYFATTGKNTEANFGASINSGKKTGENTVEFTTVAPTGPKVGDMTAIEVDWPLTSVSMSHKKEATNHLMSEYDKTQSNYTKFDLFGSVFLIKFTNILDVNPYTAYSDDPDVNNHPTLIIESNGMAFAGTSFTGTEDASGIKYDVVATTHQNRMSVTLSNVNFADNAPNLPIWFRPVTPKDGKPFYIKITWCVYNGRTWDQAIYVAQPSADKLQTNGTTFNHYDGRYYRMSVGISPVPKVEVGSNAFYVIEHDIPHFD